MTLAGRLSVAKALEKHGRIRIGNDYAVVRNGLVYIETSSELTHPISATPLENPMTWDTFTHAYLLDKGEN